MRLPFTNRKKLEEVVLIAETRLKEKIHLEKEINDISKYLTEEKELGNIAFSNLLSELNFNNEAESRKLEEFKENEQKEKIRYIFNKWGSDKSIKHNYEEVYAKIKKIFDQNFLKAKPTILEVGCGSNDPTIRHSMPLNYKPLSSLHALQEIFQTNNIVGADIDESLKDNDKFKVYFINQFEKQSFQELLNENLTFDLIIDDGVHDVFANFLTLKILFEKLNPGGFYLIEDVSLSLIPIWNKLIGSLKIENFSYLINNKIALEKDCAILIEKK